jgi:hypothetical protein
MPTLRDILTQLRSEGFLSADSESSLSVIISAKSSEISSPWYVQALVGVSAWFAAIIFLIFVFGTRLVSSSPGIITFGILLCATAIGLRWGAPKNIFIVQLALAISIAGQVMIVGQVGDKTTITIPALVTIGLQILFIVFYPDSLHRFLSTLAAVLAVLALIYDLKIQEAINLLVILLAVSTGFIWETESFFTTGKLASFHKPIGFGLATALLTILILSIIFGIPDIPETRFLTILNWRISTIGLALVLLYLEHHILSSYGLAGMTVPGSIVFGTTLILSISTNQAPGLLAALFVLILGFHRGNRILMGLAFAFLTVFIIAFYYHLNLTLLMKSIVLVSTGLVLLALRFYLVYQFPQNLREN